MRIDHVLLEGIVLGVPLIVHVLLWWHKKLNMKIKGVFGTAPLHVFLAKRFQLHALSSRKNVGVVRAPKEVLHELQFLWSCSTTEFMEKSSWSSPKHPLSYTCSQRRHDI